MSIATSGLEVLFDCYSKIEALKKLKLLEHLNDIIGGNYHELIKASVQPIEYLDYLASSQEWKEEQHDGELDVVFIDDEEDLNEVLETCNDKLKTAYVLTFSKIFWNC